MPGLQQLNRKAHPRLPFGALWYTGTNAMNDSIGYAERCRRSHNALIRVYDEAGNVIDTHEQAGEFTEP